MKRERVQIFFNDESLTRQEFKDECDLDLMLKRFKRTPEGRAALANASFMALPAIVRRRFDNDSAQFLDFILNPANIEEARSLGLAKPKEESSISPMATKGT